MENRPGGGNGCREHHQEVFRQAAIPGQLKIADGAFRGFLDQRRLCVGNRHSLFMSMEGLLDINKAEEEQ